MEMRKIEKEKNRERKWEKKRENGKETKRMKKLATGKGKKTSYTIIRSLHKQRNAQNKIINKIKNTKR